MENAAVKDPMKTLTEMNWPVMDPVAEVQLVMEEMCQQTRCSDIRPGCYHQD